MSFRDEGKKNEQTNEKWSESRILRVESWTEGTSGQYRLKKCDSNDEIDADDDDNYYYYKKDHNIFRINFSRFCIDIQILKCVIY